MASFIDVGDWLTYSKTPAYLGYQWFFVSVYSIYVIYVVVRLVWKYSKERFSLSIPTMVYILCGLGCLFRVLEIGIDNYFLFHRLPYWGRDLLLWLVCHSLLSHSNFQGTFFILDTF